MDSPSSDFVWRCEANLFELLFCQEVCHYVPSPIRKLAGVHRMMVAPGTGPPLPSRNSATTLTFSPRLASLGASSFRLTGSAAWTGALRASERRTASNGTRPHRRTGLVIAWPPPGGYRAVGGPPAGAPSQPPPHGARLPPTWPLPGTAWQR